MFDKLVMILLVLSVQEEQVANMLVIIYLVLMWQTEIIM